MRAPFDNENTQAGAGKKNGVLRRIAAAPRWVGRNAMLLCSADEIGKSARLIGGLAAAIRRSPVEKARLAFAPDGSIDSAASAFLHGRGIGEFEALLRRRQRATAISSYFAFGLGWLFFLAWLYRAATMPWTPLHVISAVEFLPFCAVFFLMAFKSALENYELRMRRLTTALRYLCAADGFWPKG